jgi:hypothetical protein
MGALKVARPNRFDPSPAHLTERSQEVWVQTVADYGMAADVAGRDVLKLALEAEDLADQVRAIVAREGICVKARAHTGVECAPKPAPWPVNITVGRPTVDLCGPYLTALS